MEISNKQYLSENLQNIDNKEEEYEEEEYEEGKYYPCHKLSERDFSLIKNVKSLFKIIEKNTIRCHRCPLIPRIRINFARSIINIECDNNHCYYYDSPLDFIKNYGNNGLEKRCNECIKSNINLFYYINYNLILCDNCEVVIDEIREEFDTIRNPFLGRRGRSCRRGGRGGGKGAVILDNSKSHNNNRISLLEIDKCCIIHKKPIIYPFNLCEDCSDDNYDYSFDLFEFPTKKIKLKDISNFLFTK